MSRNMTGTKKIQQSMRFIKWAIQPDEETNSYPGENVEGVVSPYECNPTKRDIPYQIYSLRQKEFHHLILGFLLDFLKTVFHGEKECRK